MKSVVFENLLPAHRFAVAAYRLSGRRVLCLRRGRGTDADWARSVETLAVPDPLHLGSHAPKEKAIDELPSLWADSGPPGIVSAAVDLWGDGSVENAFRKTLLLASVEAARLVLEAEQADKALDGVEIDFIPATIADCANFVALNRPLKTKGLRLPLWARILGWSAEYFRRMAWASYSAWQWLLLAGRSLRPAPPKQSAALSLAVVSPAREWANGMDFLIDGKRLNREDVLFVPLLDLSPSQKARFAQAGLRLAERHCPATALELISSASQVLGVFLRMPFTPSWALECHARTLKELWLWRAFLRVHRIKDFLAYCDFMPPHIARNVLLRRAGVRTYYLVDSINSGNVWDRGAAASRHRHEFWCYLDYDVMISWCPFYTRYQRAHPQKIGSYVEVGAVWADRIRAIEDGREAQPLQNLLAEAQGKRIVAAFDSSYHDHGVATYADGIRFLEDLLRLLGDRPDLFLLFKEKNPRGHLGTFSFVPGELEKMKDLLRRLSEHPRCRTPGQEAGAAAVIAAAELVIAYPFTSPATLALSAGKKALYFDPSGKTANCHFDDLPGMMAYDYAALLKNASAALSVAKQDHASWIAAHAKHLEPFGDGKAASRILDALAASPAAPS